MNGPEFILYGQYAAAAGAIVGVLTIVWRWLAPVRAVVSMMNDLVRHSAEREATAVAWRQHTDERLDDGDARMTKIEGQFVNNGNGSLRSAIDTMGKQLTANCEDTAAIKGQIEAMDNRLTRQERRHIDQPVNDERRGSDA